METRKPKWQKAIIKFPNSSSPFNGKLIWVRLQKPELVRGIPSTWNPEYQDWYESDPEEILSYETNIRDDIASWYHETMRIEQQNIELINDFWFEDKITLVTAQELLS